MSAPKPKPLTEADIAAGDQPAPPEQWLHYNRWVNYPVDRAESIATCDGIPGDLAAAAAALDILAWSESSRLGLDGRISNGRVRALPLWTEKRQEVLTDWTETWTKMPGCIDLYGYLHVNKSKAEVEALTEDKRKGGRERAAKAAREAGAGRFVTEPSQQVLQQVLATSRPGRSRQRAVTSPSCPRHEPVMKP